MGRLTVMRFTLFEIAQCTLIVELFNVETVIFRILFEDRMPLLVGVEARTNVTPRGRVHTGQVRHGTEISLLLLCPWRWRLLTIVGFVFGVALGLLRHLLALQNFKALRRKNSKI